MRERYFEELEKEIKELVDPKSGLLKKDFSILINCPLCGAKSSEHEELFLKNGYTFVRCQQCEMIFVNPQVKTDLLTELYGESRANNLWVKLQKSEKEKKWKKEYYLDCLALINRYAGQNELKLIDIGCSTGYFLELASKYSQTYCLKGLELNKIAIEESLAKGLNVEQKLLCDLDVKDLFDVFTMFGVLEHLPDPKTLLGDIKAHANNGAVVMAIVPNAYSLYHMFLQQNSVSFDGRNHLLYFSEKTLRKLFEDTGFNVLLIDTVLTGLDNIKRQIQWYNPYSRIHNNRYIPKTIKTFFDDNAAESLIYRYKLGLRLRIIASLNK